MKLRQKKSMTANKLTRKFHFVVTRSVLLLGAFNRRPGEVLYLDGKKNAGIIVPECGFFTVLPGLRKRPL
jgi:hypothetical protein